MPAASQPSLADSREVPPTDEELPAASSSSAEPRAPLEPRPPGAARPNAVHRPRPRGAGSSAASDCPPAGWDALADTSLKHQLDAVRDLTSSQDLESRYQYLCSLYEALLAQQSGSPKELTAFSQLSHLGVDLESNAAIEVVHQELLRMRNGSPELEVHSATLPVDFSNILKSWTEDVADPIPPTFPDLQQAQENRECEALLEKELKDQLTLSKELCTNFEEPPASSEQQNMQFEGQATDLEQQIAASQELCKTLKEQLDLSEAQNKEFQGRLALSEEHATELQQQLFVNEMECIELKRQQAAFGQRADSDNDLKQQLASSRELCTTLSQKLASSEEQNEGFKGRLTVSEEQATELQQQLFVSEGQRLELKRQLESTDSSVVNRANLDRLEAECAAATATCRQLATECADLRQQLNSSQQCREEEAECWEAREKKLQSELEAERAAAAVSCKQLEDDREELKCQLAAMETKRAEEEECWQSRCKEMGSESGRLRAELAEMQALRSSGSDGEAATGLAEKCKLQQQELSKNEAGLAQALSELANVKRQNEELQAELANVKGERDQLKAQLTAAEEHMQAQRLQVAASLEEKASSSKSLLASARLSNGPDVRKRALVTLRKAVPDGRLDAALNRWMGQDPSDQPTESEQVPAHDVNHALKEVLEEAHQAREEASRKMQIADQVGEDAQDTNCEFACGVAASRRQLVENSLRILLHAEKPSPETIEALRRELKEAEESQAESEKLLRQELESARFQLSQAKKRLSQTDSGQPLDSLSGTGQHNIAATPTLTPTPTTSTAPALAPTPTPTISAASAPAAAAAPAPAPAPAAAQVTDPTPSTIPALAPTPAPTTSAASAPAPAVAPAPAETPAPAPAATPTASTSPSPTLTPAPTPSTAPAPAAIHESGKPTQDEVDALRKDLEHAEQAHQAKENVLKTEVEDIRRERDAAQAQLETAKQTNECMSKAQENLLAELNAARLKASETCLRLLVYEESFGMNRDAAAALRAELKEAEQIRDVADKAARAELEGAKQELRKRRTADLAAAAQHEQDSQGKVHALETQLAITDASLKDSTQEVKQLKEQLKGDAEARDREYLSLQQQFQDARQQLAERSAFLDRLKAELNLIKSKTGTDAQDDLSDLRKKCAESEAARAQQEEEAKDLAGKLASLRGRLEECDDELRRARQERDEELRRARQELEKHNQQVLKLRADAETKENTNLNVQQQHHETLRQLSQQCVELDAIKAEVASARKQHAKEVEKLRGDAATKENTYLNLQQQHHETSRQLSQQCVELDAIKAEIAAARAKHTKEVEKLRGDAATKENTHLNLQQQHHETSRQLSQQCVELDAIKAEIAAARAQHEKEVQKLRGDAATKENTYLNLQQQHHETSRQLSQQSVELDAMKAEIASAREQHAKEVEKLRGDAARKPSKDSDEMDSEEISRQLSQQCAELDAVRAEMASAREQYEKEARDLSAQVAGLGGKLAERDAEVARKCQELAEVRDAHKTKMLVLQSDRDTELQVVRRHSAMHFQEKVQALEGELSASNARRERIASEKAAHEKEVRDLVAQVASVSGSLAERDEELLNLREEFTAARKQHGIVLESLVKKAEGDGVDELQFTKLQSELRDAKKRIHALETELAASNAHLTQSSKEVKELQERLESDASIMEGENVSIEQQRKEAIDLLSGRSAEVVCLEAELDAERSKYSAEAEKDMRDHHEKHAEIAAGFAEHEKEVRDLAAQVTSLSGSLAERNDELARLRQEMTDAKKEHSNQMDAMLKARGDGDADLQLARQQGELNARDKIHALESELAASHANLTDSNKKLKELQERLQSDASTREAESSTFSKQQPNATEQLPQRSAEQDSWKSELSLKQHKEAIVLLSQRSVELVCLKAELKAMRSKHGTEFEQNLREQHKKNAEVAAACAEHERQARDLAAQVASLSGRLAERDDELVWLRQEMTEAKYDHGTEMESLLKVQNQKDSELQLARQQWELDTQEKLHTLETELAASNEHLTESSKEVKDLQERLQNDASLRDTEYLSLQQQHKQATEQLSERSAELDSLKRLHDDASKRERGYFNLQQQNKEATEQLSNKYAEAVAACAEHEEAARNLTTQVTSLNRSLAERNDELAGVRQELTEAHEVHNKQMESTLKAQGDREAELRLALQQRELDLNDGSEEARCLPEQLQDSAMWEGEDLSCTASTTHSLSNRIIEQVTSQLAESLGEQDCLKSRIFELHSKYGAQLDDDLRELREFAALRTQREAEAKELAAEVASLSGTLAVRNDELAQLRRDVADAREHSKQTEALLKGQHSRDTELQLVRQQCERDANEKLQALETELAASKACLSDSSEALKQLQEQAEAAAAHTQHQEEDKDLAAKVAERNAELGRLKWELAEAKEAMLRAQANRDAELQLARKQCEQEARAKIQSLEVELTLSKAHLRDSNEELTRLQTPSPRLQTPSPRKREFSDLQQKREEASLADLNEEFENLKGELDLMKGRSGAQSPEDLQDLTAVAQPDGSAATKKDDVACLRRELAEAREKCQQMESTLREPGKRDLEPAFANLQKQHQQTSQHLADKIDELDRVKAELSLVQDIQESREKDAEMAIAHALYEEEAKDLAAKVDSLALELAEAREKNVQMEKSQSDRDTESQLAQQKHEQDAKDANDKIHALETQLAMRDAHLNDRSEEVRHLREQLHGDAATREREYLCLQEQNKQASQQLVDKSDDVERLKAEINFMKGKYDAQCEENSRQCREKDAEIAAARAHNVEEAKSLMAKVATLKGSLAESNDELERVRRELTEARDKYLQLEESLISRGNRDIEIQAGQDEQHVKDKIHALETQLALTNAHLNESGKEVRHLREQLQGDVAITEREREHLSLQQQHKHALKQLTDRSDELERLKAEMNVMKGKYGTQSAVDVEERIDNHAEIAVVHACHDEDASDLAAKVDSLSRRLTERTDELERVRSELGETREQHMHVESLLKAQCNRAADIQLAQQHSEDEAKTKIHDLETQLAVSDAHLQDSSEEVKRLREQLQGDTATREREYTSLQEQYKQAAQQFAERSDELERLKAENHEKDAQIAAAHERHEDEMKEVAAKVASLSGSLEERNAELERLRQELVESREKYFRQWEDALKAQGDRDTEFKLVRQQCEQEAATVASLTAALAERSEALAKLRKELEDATTRFSALQEEAMRFRFEKEAELSVLRQSHENESRDSASQLELKNSKSETQIAGLQDSLALRSEELERLRAELKEMRSSVSTNMEDAMKAKNEKDLELVTARMLHTEEAGALATQVSNLTKALTEKEEIVQQCRSELRDMQQSCTAQLDAGLNDRRDLQAQLAAHRQKHAEDAEDWASRVAGVNQKLAGRNSQLDELRAELDGVVLKAEQDLMELRTQLQSVRGQRDECQGQLDNEKKQRQEQEAALQSCESKLDMKEGQLKKLSETLVSAHQDEGVEKEKLEMRNRELLSALDAAKTANDARKTEIEQKDAVRAALESQLKSQMTEAFAAINATNSASEMSSAKAAKRESQLEALLEAEKRSLTEATRDLVAAKNAAEAMSADDRKRADELSSALEAARATSADALAAAHAHADSLHAEARAERAIADGKVSELEDSIAGMWTVISSRENEVGREAATAKADADAQAMRLEEEVARLEGDMLATSENAEVRCASFEETNASLWIELSAAELRCAGLEESAAVLWTERSSNQTAAAALLETSRSQVASLQKLASELEAELASERRARLSVEGRYSTTPQLPPMQLERRSDTGTPGFDSLPPPRPQTALEMQQSARGSTPSVERPPRPHTVTDAAAGPHQINPYTPRRHIDIDVKQFAGPDGQCPACKKCFGSRARLIKHLQDESKPVCKHFCRCHVKPLPAEKVAALDEYDRARRKAARASQACRDTLSGSFGMEEDWALQTPSPRGPAQWSDEDIATPHHAKLRSTLPSGVPAAPNHGKARATLPRHFKPTTGMLANCNSGEYVGLQQIWRPMA